MLAVGERGHQPAVTVWALATGTVLRELTGAHRFGIGCVLFTPGGNRVVTMGFKHDRMLRVGEGMMITTFQYSNLRLCVSPRSLAGQTLQSVLGTYFKVENTVNAVAR